MNNDYERRAREAERMAGAAKDAQERLGHEQVARIWRELAERRRRRKSADADDG
jgi:hypothetical protein